MMVILYMTLFIYTLVLSMSLYMDK